ncbi:sphingosine kinase [Histoplasma capsulatum var. duboisii H88]|uniref:Sphingosine kinase n=2 Tax=Ajellomyces capsulatus TaxID=5037 RepID=F0UCS4_AJEC8|nr:sphingosine kinase [Histoplasma capsulatum H143]EGC43350.1 sphingosine kinase [Histoplasma capsulatum var. duboisii H88]QSS49532.1 sphingosine kinase [Histoplasma capsulatum var. duboisii H88]
MTIDTALDAGLSGNNGMASVTDGLLQSNSENSATLPVGRNVFLTLTDDALIVADKGIKSKSQRRCCSFPIPGSASQSIPYFNILWAELSDNYITIKYADQVTKKDVTLRSVQYSVNLENKSKAKTWTQELLDLAYGKAQRQKRIKVLINPFGGKGHAPKDYLRYVEPIFAAAKCQVDVESTSHRGHAVDIVEKLDVNAYDVVVACSGDGIPYEIFNGLAKKPNASEALRKIAVAHIPCGSGNAMSWNLNGTDRASLAAVSIVKGLRTPLDLVSITQGDKRTVSFLSQSFGIIAELDLGTENIRWMGSARFTYGFLVRLLGKTVYPCDLAIKVELDNKELIKDHYRAGSQRRSLDQLRDEESSDAVGLPPLRYGTVNDPLPEGWTLVPHDKLGNFYAGNMAYMAADSNFFPAALPNDGCMDLITVNGDISRRTAIQMLMSVDDGAFFDMPEVNVRKVTGYRIIPRDRKEGYISIDGEQVPFEPFQAEVHKGLGTVLSRSGYKYETNGLK